MCATCQSASYDRNVISCGTDIIVLWVVEFVMHAIDYRFNSKVKNSSCKQGQYTANVHLNSWWLWLQLLVQTIGFFYWKTITVAKWLTKSISELSFKVSVLCMPGHGHTIVTCCDAWIELNPCVLNMFTDWFESFQCFLIKWKGKPIMLAKQNKECKDRPEKQLSLPLTRPTMRTKKPLPTDRFALITFTHGKKWRLFLSLH